MNNACRHAVSADEWIQHYCHQNDEYRREKGGPERLDFASIPLHLVSQDRGSNAAQFLRRWKDWYAYEVAEHLFTLLHQAEVMETIPAANVRHFLDSLRSPGVLAAAISFIELDSTVGPRLIGELARVCEKKRTVNANRDFNRERNYLFQDGVLKAATIAVAMKMNVEALAIVETIAHERPSLWSFSGPFTNNSAFPFIIYTAVRSAALHQSVTEHTLLPQELFEIGSRVSDGFTGHTFQKALKFELEERFKSQKGLSDEKRPMSYDIKRDAERFIDERHAPLLEISRVFTTLLSSDIGRGDKRFLELISVWIKLRIKQEHYLDVHEANLFFDLLGRQLLIFSLWSRSDLKVSSVEAFVAKVSEDGIAPASTLTQIVGILSKRPDLHELAGKTAIKARDLIEREDEVNFRASLFAQLSRAIMPASFDETASYFRAGLEQMDAIGSGDYKFTNELLLFAAELRGDELEENDFHTLSNICELNMSFEEEKFPWMAFARGLARTSGCRTLAKLGRWDDRDKISLDYTLLPYLTALIQQDKIDPSIALALLRVSDPAELWVCGTEQLAEVISEKRYPNAKELLSELILQFEQNHPDVFMPSTLATLHKIAERDLGKNSEQSIYLSLAVPKFEQLRDEGNENRNYHGAQDPYVQEKTNDQKEEKLSVLKKIEDETNPADESSMSRAIDALNSVQHVFDLKAGFFKKLRAKLKFAERPKYVQIISRLETLDIYTKLSELKECKEKWGTSSVALEKIFRDIGAPLIQIHAETFVQFDYLSSSQLMEVSELTGIPMPELALEFITIFATPDSHLPASIWIGLAAIISKKTNEGEGQIALKRLLNSSSAKLASTVVDGMWEYRLYPKGGENDIAAGLVWLSFGSPSAARRWRAAHSIRCFARLGKWEVVDALIGKFHSTDAHPYQAPELPFYFLHARLWLLIAIARMAIDHPHNVAKYEDTLKAIALDKNVPHVLLRHFAAQALLACASSGSNVLSETDVKVLKAINTSPFPMKKMKKYTRDSFYQGRPDSMPEPEPMFYMDYDFDKTDVTNVSDMFYRSRWDTKDALTAWVRTFDPQISSMYENNGRSVRQRDRISGMTARYHLYGQQLGWHALYLVVGEFLAKYPVVQGPYDDDNSWREWLGRELLTRDDGLWLADGVDRPPVDAQVNLYEKGDKELIVTGDRTKLLALLNIQSSIGGNVVVAGEWPSADGIGIHITSALVPTQHANKLALQLSQEEPFQAWLPGAEGDDSDYENSPSKRVGYSPWIVWPSTVARLDETDPLGVTSAVRRIRFTREINAIKALKSMDPFRREWIDKTGQVAARSEAWGRNPKHNEEDAISAERLVCSSDFLKDVLVKKRAELLVLIKLCRYDKGFGSRGSQYWHTTAVVRIDHSLDLKFFPGAINKLHTIKY